MAIQSLITSSKQPTLLAQLHVQLASAKPSAVGFASAYVSVFGIDKLRKLLTSTMKECRLLAGTDGEITHPLALEMAQSAGWKVRIGNSPEGIFHPKMIIGGNKFEASGGIEASNFVYVGSGNLTRGGLHLNVECGFTSSDAAETSQFSSAFAKLWNAGSELTPPLLEAYKKRFTERNRSRSAQDLKLLGVADYPNLVKAPTKSLQSQSSQSIYQSVPTTYANVAWAGLQSFTGEYQFQVEFPRAAGEVIQNILVGTKIPVKVECEDKIRDMNFHYYADNSMFRLNIPFDVPNVEWARENHDGIALVQRGRNGGPPIGLRIILPGDELTEVVGKSVALGTWGKTTTRLYGWM